MKAEISPSALTIIAVSVIISLVSLAFAYPGGWGDDVRVTFSSVDSFFPSIAIDSNNNVHITWRDDRDGNAEIYYTKLDNNGNTLVDDKRLTFNSAYSEHPSIAIDSDNNVHIA
jgi:hypothetical protein